MTIFKRENWLYFVWVVWVIFATCIPPFTRFWSLVDLATGFWIGYEGAKLAVRE